MELYVVRMSWENYLFKMSRMGVYGDQITLQAAANIFNVGTIVVSTLTETSNSIIVPYESIPMVSFHLGHVAEGQGDHYVALNKIDERGEAEFDGRSR